MKKALSLHPAAAHRLAGKNCAGRDVLSRAQPAVRRGVHLLPEGRR
ncbi:MAG: hypothetical protein MZV63_64490 [Marinilabiliales bacterium]|nr:hypothetical protein [Marinilabiliales bacterium]